jgi:anti-anti-sigma factor
MSFSVKSEIKENVAIVTMAGDLDSSTAPQLHEEIKKVVQENPKELVLCVEELNFMASAGMRVIIFAKQKLGSAASLILVKPQEQVQETLRMTGLLHSISIVDKYPE